MPMTLRSGKTTYAPMANMKCSQPNWFEGQSICGARDFNMRNTYENHPNEAEKKQILQTCYDMGCALLSLGIVRRKILGCELNPDFGDYHDWKNAEICVADNCQFLTKMGHPGF